MVFEKCGAPYLPIAPLFIPSLCTGNPLCGLLPQRLIKLPRRAAKEKAAQQWLRTLLLYEAISIRLRTRVFTTNAIRTEAHPARAHIRMWGDRKIRRARAGAALSA